MDPNYDDLNDFFGIDPTVENEVREYLRLEWILDLDDYPHHIHEKALQLISDLRGKDNARNIASKIAMEVIPI
jgi:hypothetical protein